MAETNQPGAATAKPPAAPARARATAGIKAGAEVYVRHLLPGPVVATGKGKVEAVNDDDTLEISVASALPRAGGQVRLSGVLRRSAEGERGMKVLPCPRWWTVEEHEPPAEPEKKK